MKSTHWLLISTFIILGIFFYPSNPVQAGSRGCDITQFSLSPDGDTVSFGEVIALSGKSNCGTVRFEINGSPRSEIGSTDQTMNFNTAEWGAGNHNICFVARGDGGWENADRKCRKITVKQPDRGCNIQSFTLSPDNSTYQIGTVVALNGHSDCGTVRFLIDGQSRSEIGSTDQSMNFNTSEWGVGNHTICFSARGNGGWEMADEECRNINVSENKPNENEKSDDNSPSDNNSPSSSEDGCNYHAKFIEDVTLPDNTIVPPNTKITKTWRVVNDGNCKWDTSFTLIKNSGDISGGETSIPKTIKPGETIDLSVSINTPSTPGEYKAYWIFRDAGGNQFKAKLYVKIIVKEGASVSDDSKTQVSNDLDFGEYCKKRGYDRAFPNNDFNAKSWICEKPGDQSFVNYNDVCKQQKGNNYVAKASDDSDPYSWSCEKKEQNSLIPQAYAAEVENLDIVDNGKSYDCGKQCVALIREKFPDSRNWGILGKSTPQEWYDELVSHKGEKYAKAVYIRKSDETPKPNDLIIWSNTCSGGIAGSGHTGIVAGFNASDKKRLRVNDYNFGNPRTCWTNNPRTYNPDCMLFLEVKPETEEVEVEVTTSEQTYVPQTIQDDNSSENENFLSSAFNSLSNWLKSLFSK